MAASSCGRRGLLRLNIVAAALATLAPLAQADNLLSLYQAARTADANYLGARADADGRREAKPQALAQLLPNVSYSHNQNNNDTLEKTKLQERTYNYTSLQQVLSLRQPLFRAYNFALYAQSGAEVESADASEQLAEQELAVRVGSAYFDALLAQSDLDVNQAQQQAYAAQMQMAEKAFAAGHGTRIDIDEARAKLDLVRAQAMELQQRVEYTLGALRAIVNRPLTPLAALNAERMALEPPTPARLEEWIQVAEDLSPKLKSLRANVEVAEMEIWKARAGHLPTVDLIAQKSKSDSENTLYLNRKLDNEMIGIQATVPLFAGGYVNSTIRQARAGLEKANQQLEAARRETGLQVRKEFDAAVQGVHAVQAYQLALKSAEQTLHSTRKGLQAGARSNIDVLNAEQNLATARRDYNRSRYLYALARMRLLSLVGRLDESEMLRFNSWLD